MFVFKFKVNGNRLFKTFLICSIVLLLIIVCVVTFRVISGAKNNPNNSTCLPQNNVNTISTNNYTNVLKSVHDNIDDYVGVQINFTGYVYRVLDLKENQFVLARDMIISSDFQSVIVGFLCEYEKASDFKDNTWVEITGQIYKGNYHGDMPIVRVTEINEVDKPNDEYVYPPDETYIPTDGIV